MTTLKQQQRSKRTCLEDSVPEVAEIEAPVVFVKEEGDVRDVLERDSFAKGSFGRKRRKVRVVVVLPLKGKVLGLRELSNEEVGVIFEEKVSCPPPNESGSAVCEFGILLLSINFV
jgi:hypothetical protein